MFSLRAQLVIAFVLLSTSAQDELKPPAPTRHALCQYFDAVLREAGANFAALRGQPLKGYDIPVWEGRLKPPGGTLCKATEKSYVCSLGVRPDKAKGKREFDLLAFRTLACFPGWSTRTARSDFYWSFVAHQGKLRVSVDYLHLDSGSMRLDSPEDAKNQPELWLTVSIVSQQTGSMD
jgi:hypothetical protein